MKSLRDDPLQIFCNATSLGHILSAANDTLDQLSEVFCSTPPEQIFNLINTTALFNEVRPFSSALCFISHLKERLTKKCVGGADAELGRRKHWPKTEPG